MAPGASGGCPDPDMRTIAVGGLDVGYRSQTETNNTRVLTETLEEPVLKPRSEKRRTKGHRGDLIAKKGRILVHYTKPISGV